MDNNKNRDPILIYQPQNLLKFMTFYSPIIVAVAILSISFVFQSFSGLIYVSFLLAITIVREYILITVIGTTPISEEKDYFCNAVQFNLLESYENSGYSIFALCFTIFYLCTPMFINGDINYVIMGILIAYLLIDIGMKYSIKCITDFASIIGNMISGSLFGIIITIILISTNSSKYLMFNETSSNMEVCSVPTSQKFKCSVYKNGQLVKTH
jgi:hypothetical protein